MNSREVIQLFGDDGSDHVQIEAGVFMYSHVAKADHSLHAAGKVNRKNLRSLIVSNMSHFLGSQEIPTATLEREDS